MRTPVTGHSIAIGVSVCLSAHEHISNSKRRNYIQCCMLPVAVGRACSGGAVIRYVLPVLFARNGLATHMGHE